MSTLTPNYGLIVPDGSDTVEQVRADYATNLNTIDGIGGGGSGGHTIVNENGTDMPAEGKLQFTGGVTVTDDSVNGKTVVDISGGGGNVYGAFIDTNRIITSGTYSGTFSYTATEDCAFRFVVSGTSSSSGKVFLDNVIIQSVYVPNNNDYQDVVFVKKGQTVRVESQQGGTWNYTVYGLTQGTSGIFTPIIYSDNERVVGVWRDNKPLYQRILTLTQDTALVMDSWVKTEFNKDTMETLVRVNATIGTSGAIIEALSGGFIDGKLALNSARTVGLNVSDNARLIVQYTKTTDVAGSGNWNTDGVPTVHYSTSEQVIGTWIDGKPIYQCTWTGTKTTNAEEVVISGLVTLDTLVDSKVIFKGNTGAQIAQYFRDASDFGRCWFDSNGIHMDLGNSYPIRPVTWYITLQYTKTTD